MFLHVTSVECLEDYKLRLKFNNEEVRTVDLSQELYGEIFETLREIDFFKQVSINPETNTIEWPNGADFAPEYLFDLTPAFQQTA